MKKLIKRQGMFHVLYSAAMMVYAGVHTTFAPFWMITGVLLLVIGTIKGTIGSVLRLMAAAADGFIIWQTAQIYRYGKKEPDQGAAYVIILGAQVKGRRPSRALLRRIRAAAAYLRENPSCKAVACGGRGKGEWITECECIRENLIDMGVAKERIICENRSVSTYENFMFAKELIGTKHSIVIASNSFHLYRAIEIAKRVGFSKCQGLGTEPEPMLELNYYVRECLSLWYNRIRSLWT